MLHVGCLWVINRCHYYTKASVIYLYLQTDYMQCCMSDIMVRDDCALYFIVFPSLTPCFYTPAQRSWRGGILDSPCPSVCPSVRPSVCRRHGFRSISQVCFGISISNFICMLMVAIGRSLLIFSDVTFKMAAWQPYWIFWFPDSNFTSALNINFKLQRHNTYVYG